VRMADCDVLPLDYVAYAKEISAYIQAAKRKATDMNLVSIDFDAAQSAAAHLLAAAQRIHAEQAAPPADSARLNLALRQAETALLSPGEYTGYAAVVIPGVNEAIDARNSAVAVQQLAALTEALDRAAGVLSSAR
jgi:N-acetylated-alpha-linked acidic dipeptidase